MPVELAQRYPFSVDTWTEASTRKRFHFLTHAHKDHTAGIENLGFSSIYCTDITQKLVIRRYPKLIESAFVTLVVGEAKLIPDEEEPFTVTAYDANHCPGAVMLLFEGIFGSVLHTGDCRLTRDCLNQLPAKYVMNAAHKGGTNTFDCLYLDCTFGKEMMAMPTRQDAIQQVIKCIWNHPDAPVVYLACDLLGQEDLLQEVSKSFQNAKIYADKSKLSEYITDLTIVDPDLLTDCQDLTRFQICEGFPKLYERAQKAFAEALARGAQKPLFIRPSAQWYTFEERPDAKRMRCINKLRPQKEAEKDQFGVWHVCFSMHSSRQELQAALDVMLPKKVISSTPHCAATELVSTGSDADKKRKGFSTEHEGRSTSKVVEQSPCFMTAAQVESFSTIELKENQDVEFASPQRPVSLFGMARNGVPPSPPLSFVTQEPDALCISTLVTQDIVTNPTTQHSLAALSVQVDGSTIYSADKILSMVELESPDMSFIQEPLSPCNRKLFKFVDKNNQFQHTNSPSGFQDGKCQKKVSPSCHDRSVCISNMTTSEGIHSKQQATSEGIDNKYHEQVGSRKGVARQTEYGWPSMYRRLRVPIPQPLPSLLDLANFPPGNY
ncbi:unnamed protein product [Sphagnum troendelagicum]|uniref:DNA repair metallo-beta-lactamase domain-containing protein n=1 Tax=Sphagnum troendelagicum TaxID=128251 RepID=A0ABP0UB62_9BRYO